MLSAVPLAQGGRAARDNPERAVGQLARWTAGECRGGEGMCLELLFDRMTLGFAASLAGVYVAV